MQNVIPFLQAKSDTIDSLEPYREKSMPTFLMFAVSIHLIIGRVDGDNAYACLGELTKILLSWVSQIPPSLHTAICRTVVIQQ
jgi:hypothetical protein